MKRPRIGMLDSGVGGWSVLRAIRESLPHAAIHYVGDSSWCPYGAKSHDVICGRVGEIADYLLSHGAELLVIACNTATIHAVGDLRATYPVPIVGMEPAVKRAAEATRTGTIAVLATEASLAGEKFHRLVSTHASGIRVITRPCPLFVELVEKGILAGPEVEAAIDEVVQPLLAAAADVLVLGCTHYPFLRRAIEERLPEGVTVLDTGAAVANRVKSLVPPCLPDDIQEGDRGPVRIETTGDLEHMRRLLPVLLPGIQSETGICPL